MAWALRAWRLRRASPRVSGQNGPNLLIASLPIAISRRKDAASSGQIFDTLSKPENLQHAFAGGGKGLARAAARPALAKMQSFWHHRSLRRGTTFSSFGKASASI